jgi:hypothetical protein
VAKPSAYLKKTIKLKISSKGEDSQGNATMEITLDDSNIRNAILEATAYAVMHQQWLLARNPWILSLQYCTKMISQKCWIVY